jgi:hypothetical protein
MNGVNNTQKCIKNKTPLRLTNEQYSDFLRNLLGESFLHLGGGDGQAGGGEGRGDGSGKPHGNVAMNGNGKRMLEDECGERCTKKRCFQVAE